MTESCDEQLGHSVCAWASRTVPGDTQDSSLVCMDYKLYTMSLTLILFILD